jgi:excisionase family DNA binding protein
MALSRGAGLKREGPSGTAPGKAWPLLFSDSAHPLGAQSESDAGGNAGASWGGGGCRKTPPVRSDREREGFHMTCRLLDIKEVAAYTGLSVHTLYTMVSQRRIPYVKMGRLVKFDLELLDKWIKQQTVMTMPSKRV